MALFSLQEHDTMPEGLAAMNVLDYSPFLPGSNTFCDGESSDKARSNRNQPNGGQSRFSLVSWCDLLSTPDTPVDYLLEGRLVAGTVSAIVAKPKVGKSTLARNLALAVSAGKEFLGCSTRQGEVIYLAMEERPEDIKADFAAMGATG